MKSLLLAFFLFLLAENSFAEELFNYTITSDITLFSRSESFNDLDPLRTTDPPLIWQPAQTFLKIVSPSLISEAIRYCLLYTSDAADEE